MAGEDNPNWCFVEDYDTSAAIVELMRHDSPASWPRHDWRQAPVWIHQESSLSNLFKARTLRVEMARSGRKAMGIVVDAEQKEDLAPWKIVKEFATSTESFIDVPNDMPEDGLVITDTSGRKFGLWIMPDNKSKGMLEDFLRQLVPGSSAALWAFAEECVGAARQRGASCCPPHLPKAHLHTWLAWQDFPGERIGVAIAKKYLDPGCETAMGFIRWFKRLYGL